MSLSPFANNQAERDLGLRRARYRGLAKTHLQEMATAAAIDDIGRVMNWHNDIPLAATRSSQFTRLAVA